MEKTENNYPIGMHPPIDSYKYPKNIDKWNYCPKCGLKPRVWEFDNGRSTHCGCSNNTYDHFSVKAKPVGEFLRETGGFCRYDGDELRKNWNEYCKNYK